MFCFVKLNFLFQEIKDIAGSPIGWEAATSIWKQLKWGLVKNKNNLVKLLQSTILQEPGQMVNSVYHVAWIRAGYFPVTDW